MFSLGLFGWAIALLMPVAVCLAIYYLNPSSGRHGSGRRPDVVDRASSTAVIETPADVQATAVLVGLYGVPDVISGYLVDADRPVSRSPDSACDEELPPPGMVRPYLVDHWRRSGRGIGQHRGRAHIPATHTPRRSPRDVLIHPDVRSRGPPRQDDTPTSSEGGTSSADGDRDA